MVVAVVTLTGDGTGPCGAIGGAVLCDRTGRVLRDPAGLQQRHGLRFAPRTAACGTEFVTVCTAGWDLVRAWKTPDGEKTVAVFSTAVLEIASLNVMLETWVPRSHPRATPITPPTGDDGLVARSLAAVTAGCCHVICLQESSRDVGRAALAMLPSRYRLMEAGLEHRTAALDFVAVVSVAYDSDALDVLTGPLAPRDDALWSAALAVRFRHRATGRVVRLVVVHVRHGVGFSARLAAGIDRAIDSTGTDVGACDFVCGDFNASVVDGAWGWRAAVPVEVATCCWPNDMPVAHRRPADFVPWYNGDQVLWRQTGAWPSLVCVETTADGGECGGMIASCRSMPVPSDHHPVAARFLLGP